MSAQPQIRVIGDNGQISLGKKFAGKMVSIEQVENGTWMIKAGEFIPDSEKWLHRDGNMEKIERALAWAKQNPPTDDLNEFLAEIGMSDE